MSEFANGSVLVKYAITKKKRHMFKRRGASSGFSWVAQNIEWSEQQRGVLLPRNILPFVTWGVFFFRHILYPTIPPQLLLKKHVREYPQTYPCYTVSGKKLFFTLHDEMEDFMIHVIPLNCFHQCVALSNFKSSYTHNY